MRTGQTSFIYAGSKFFGSIVGFVATVYFARVLGESVLGQYALALTLVTWATLVADVGLYKSLIKRISEGLEPEQYVTSGFVLVGAMGALVSLVLIVSSGYVNDYVGAPVTEFVVLLTFVGLLNSVVNASLHGKNLVHVSAILSAVGRTARGGFQVSLVVVGFGLVGLLGGHVIAVLLTSVVALWYLRPQFAVPEKRHFTSLFDFAKYAWLGNVRSKVVTNADIAVLGFFVSSGLIGVYSVVWSIAIFLDIFGNAILNSLFPEMSNQSEQENIDRVASSTEDALTYTGFLLIPGLVGGWVIGDRLLRVYGPGFVRGTAVIGILLGGVLVYSYAKQLLNTLNAIDRPDLAFRANALFSAMNVGLNVVLISVFGWVGAATATALSAVVGLSVSLWYTKRLIPFSVPTAEIARQWVAALSMGVIVSLARSVGEQFWLATTNEVFVAVLVIAGASTYVTILAVISPAFRSTVWQNLPSDTIAGRGH